MDSPSRSNLFGDSTHKTLLGFFLFLSLAPSFAEIQISDELTAYQMLEKYDFPKGILPQGVQSYALNQAGSFEVYLNGDCEFEVTRGYLLHYKRRITGTVGVGSLTNLRGVRVKVLFLWFGINEVVRSGDELKFYLGPLSASFGLSNFEECPSCRCGFDCADAMVSDS
ncbi:hypothetical protein BHE74_00003414 [Ensete ventricosum]|nr:hypothetical protein GW17_00003098 [Ensete ventricosum]RWW87742.1 hypothetical protein BHE74_00003414 [Ensete ventricosum]RZR83500.1 hypothetical protein BHM03_00010111 [Ensete ventricosum]